MLRKLQMAVNHIADVIDYAPGSALPELNEALDLIHQARERHRGGRVTTSLTVQRMTLDDSTARKLKRLTERIDTADEKRDQLMAEAAAAGASLRELAAVTGLNYVTVRNRIRKITATADAAGFRAKEQHRDG
jgi:DNA-directed RNA polymerase specialized sigma24 family protein